MEIMLTNKANDTVRYRAKGFHVNVNKKSNTSNKTQLKLCSKTELIDPRYFCKITRTARRNFSWFGFGGFPLILGIF